MSADSGGTRTGLSEGGSTLLGHASLLMTTAAIRDVEHRALATSGEGALMRRAAEALAGVCGRLLRDLPARTPVLALVGPGNNGGDALLAAAILSQRGHLAQGLTLQPDPPAAADAARVWRDWRGAGHTLAVPADLDALLAQRPLVIDGLFGIGLTRPLPDATAAIVRGVARAGVPVVAVDVPSGLDADRGSVVGPDGAVAMRASVTVTMIADKPGLHTGAGAELAGQVVVADLGTGPLEAGDTGATPRGSARSGIGTLLDARAFGGSIGRRARDSHKGRFGDVLVLGGAPGMRGASWLAALGAQAVGAGRVLVARPDSPADGAGHDARHPELMTRRLGTWTAPPGNTDAARLTDAAIRALGSADAIVAGCGLGTDATARAWVEAALAHPAPLVLDADALNVVAADAGLRAAVAARARSDGDPARTAARSPTILTPHPLEAARLLRSSTADVQRDRVDAARRLARLFGAVVALKGAGTVIAHPDGEWAINGSGGPILATAGTGDVLAGTIGGLLATGVPAMQAVALGVWLHGEAGDALAREPGYAGSIGLAAGELPAAIRVRINRLAAGRS